MQYLIRGRQCGLESSHVHIERRSLCIGQQGGVVCHAINHVPGAANGERHRLLIGQRDRA